MVTRTRGMWLHDRDGNGRPWGAIAGIIVCLISISLLVPRPSGQRTPRTKPIAVAAEKPVDAPPTAKPQSVEQVASSSRGVVPSDASRSLSDPRTPPPPPAGLPNKFELAKYDRPTHAAFLERQASTVRSGMPGEESPVPRTPSTADEMRTRRLIEEAHVTEVIEARAEGGSAPADE